MRIMRRMRNLADVQLRKQYENEGLNERHEQTQRHQQYGHNPIRFSRRQVRNGVEHLLVREHVRKQTNAQREWPNQVADQFNDKDERRNPPNRPRKVLQVSKDSVFFYPDVVVIKERSQT